MGNVQRQRSILLGPLALLVFAVAVVLALGVDARRARGEDAAASPVQAALPTPEQTKEVLEDPSTERLEEESATDLQAAERLPHRGLDRAEALELADQVFGVELESAAGVFDELEPQKFLSDFAAIIPSPDLPEPPAGEADQPPVDPLPQGQVLVESTLPLRTENAEGEEEAVDLTLQGSEDSGGALEPENPLTDLEIPAQLGEGIALPGIGVEIAIAGAPDEQTASNVDQEYAFYPNVAENTDLIVSPTPTGVETLTQIRSADAPRQTTYQLSFPEGDTLEASEDGGAEIIQNGRPLVVIPAPTATDAAGKPVPVEMQVEGMELTVSAAPDPDAAYPILVDPHYIAEGSNWLEMHDTLAAWTDSTTTPSYLPRGFQRWNPTWEPGLDITSGFAGPAYYGTHADWSYWVPRYFDDISNPRTWGGLGYARNGCKSQPS